MMLLTCADVVLRLFGSPIPGTYEMVGFLGAVIIAFALAYTSLEKGHIAVEILVDRLPREAAGMSIEAVTSLIGASLFGLLTWQSLIYAADLRQSGEVSAHPHHADLPLHLRDRRRRGLLVLVLLLDGLRLRKTGLKP